MANRIFSGIQPTGNLHLGNYLGAIRNWVRLQNDFECLFCLVDLHAITVWQDPKDLTANTREVAAGLLAAGIDAKSCILFAQSRVPARRRSLPIFIDVAGRRCLRRATFRTGQRMAGAAPAGGASGTGGLAGGFGEMQIGVADKARAVKSESPFAERLG